MQNRKLDIFFGFPSYGGNGGIASEVPDIREWFVEAILAAKKDERIGNIVTRTLSDTPVTMVRNQFVNLARQNKCDILVMVDSDQNPNLHKREEGFKPFFETSFDYLYKHYDRGPIVIGAPYCGPPDGTENCYIFYWDNEGYRGDETRMRLEKYSRAEASRMRGIQEAAALPTGLIMYDMRAFELIEPSKLTKREVLAKVAAGEMSPEEGYRNMTDGWFYYEWEDNTCSKKASTEDVTNTRDISLIGIRKLGYNPVFCNWDSPIGHWKPWCVRGRPIEYTPDHVGATFERAITRPLAAEHWTTLSGDSWSEYIAQHGVRKVAEPEEPPAMFTHDGALYLRDIAGKKVFGYGHCTNDHHLLCLRDVIGQIRIEKDRRLYGVEVGTWVGEAAAMIQDCFFQLFCVDPHCGSAGDPTRKHVSDVGVEAMRHLWKGNTDQSVCELVSLASPGAASEFSDNAMDVVIIDADHTYDAVKADIDAWWPKVKADGYMIGHDYGTGLFPGVVKAVEDSFPSNLVNVFAMNRFGGYWMVSKAAVLAERNGKHTADSAS